MAEVQSRRDDLQERRHAIEALYALLDARACAEKSGEQFLLYLIDIAILEARRVATDGQ
jgi:hypothetical protein